MIHVCFCLYDKTGLYSKFTGTAMLSLFENTNAKVAVHLLHDNTLTQENRDKFICVAGRFNQQVNFYNVDELCADKLAKICRLIPDAKISRVSIGAFFKFLIPQVLSPKIEKCIYLDSDIAVNLDVAQLWRVALDDNFLGVVPVAANRNDVAKAFPLVADGLVSKNDYFNSGVMLMNLKLLRGEEERIIRGIKFRGENPQQIFWDQTVWNYCFATQALTLPTKFNRYTRAARAEKESPTKKIYHFVGQNSYWSFGTDTNDPFNRLWMNYFIRTPWFDAQAIGRLSSRFKQMYSGLKNGMVKFSAIMSGKTRAFFTPSANFGAVKKFFNVRDDEEIILSDDKNAIENLVYAMGKAHGRKVFFIIVQNFDAVNDLLTQLDFVRGEDFFNGTDFLSETHGVPFDSLALIKAL